MPKGKASKKPSPDSKTNASELSRYREHSFELFGKKVSVCAMGFKDSKLEKVLKIFNPHYTDFICLEREAAEYFHRRWRPENFHPILIKDYAPPSLEEFQTIFKVAQQKDRGQLLICCLSGCGRSGVFLIALHILSQLMKAPSIDLTLQYKIPFGDYVKLGELSVSKMLFKAWKSIKSKLPGENDFPIERAEQAESIENLILTIQEMGIDDFMKADFSSSSQNEQRSKGPRL